MVETHILHTAKDALMRHFKTLEYVGNGGAGDEFRLLAMLFAAWCLHGEAEWFVSEEDYRTLRGLLSSVEGGCLAPYEAWCVDRAQLGDPRKVRPLRPRRTEDGGDYDMMFRESERGRLRVTERDLDE